MVAWFHFPIQCFLDCSITNQYEVAEFEVEVLNGIGVVFFEFYGCFDARFVDTTVELRQVFPTFLECGGSIGDEVGSG